MNLSTVSAPCRGTGFTALKRICGSGFVALVIVRLQLNAIRWTA
jgi:hypothetical protein